MRLTKDQLWSLRREIVLNSIYINDYRNSFGIDERVCCDYFEGYIDYLSEFMREDPDYGRIEFSSLLDRYDTPENLYAWDMCIDWDGFPMTA